MAVVKTKPTSAGRRFLVKIVNPELHKGKPHAALTSSQKQVETIMDESQFVTVEAATNIIIE